MNCATLTRYIIHKMRVDLRNFLSSVKHHLQPSSSANCMIFQEFKQSLFSAH